ncbi:hypothetical protein [uncultured Methanomethylovorans sp.]|uniref:hypothetical protein n=1 Tax=uncultured Methanomethylovorans sp. TaxID=183759 RepID=UPI002AA6E905|nr:hypothetical protein [uncultured Methanomethylovorans sp.]
MKGYKKDQLHAKQRYITILKTNKQLTRLNIVILSIGLVSSYLGKETIGVPLLWTGIVIFLYTMLSNIMVRRSLKKLK